MYQPRRRKRPPDAARRAGLGRRGAPEPLLVHFLHIGKTGGTTFKDTMERARQRCKGETRQVYTVRLHNHGTSLRDIPNGERFFFFLRDPVSRFVSGFNSRRRWGRPRYFIPWSPQELNAFRRFATPDRLACALSSPDADERAAARAAMRSIRHVGDGYWKWFASEAYFLTRIADLFFIGFQPDLAADLEILTSKLGLPESLSLPDDRVRSHRGPPNLDATLSETALANLNAWYAEDFRFLALCERVIHENPRLRSPGRANATARRPMLA